jgi:O-glycosyl hydrolase
MMRMSIALIPRRFLIALAVFALANAARAQNPATDDFERSQLGNMWRVVFGAVSVGISSGDVGLVVDGARFGVIERHNAQYASDQFSEGVVAAARLDSFLTQVFVRRRESDAARYGFHWNDKGSQWEIKYDGVPTANTRILASIVGATPRRGDTLRIEARGRELRGLVNGREILRVVDSVTTAILEPGQPGLAFRFTVDVPATYPAPAFAFWRGGSLRDQDTVSSVTTVVVDATRPGQRFEGFGATTLSLVYGANDYLTPEMRARAIEAVYGEVGLTMGQVEPGLMETPATATDLWSQRRNDNDDPFAINPAGFNWIASDVMKSKVIEPAQVFGLDNWSLANKINTQGVLNFLDPLRTANYQRYLDEAAEYTVAGLTHWRDSYGIIPRWVAPWNEPTSGNREIVGASTQTLVDLVKVIGRRMADSGFGETMLVVPNEETVQRSYDVARSILEDAEARQYVGAIGYHAYPYESPYSSVRQILEQSGRGRPVSAQLEIRRRLVELSTQYDVPVWMTEISEGPGNNDFPFGAFENVRARAIHIHDEIRYAGASAYYGMNAMWDRRSHEEHFAGRGVDFFSESSAIALVDRDSVYISGIGYAIGHYARWIDRGAVILAAESSDSLVQATAFRVDSSGDLVVVLINNASAPREVRIGLRGLTVSSAIAGEQSTAEYRWRSIGTAGEAGADSIVVTVPPESVTTIATQIQEASAVQPIKHAIAPRIEVWPNPTRDQLVIRHNGEGAGRQSLFVTDVYGNQVMVRQLQHSALETALDVAQLESGIYFVLLRSRNGLSPVRFTVIR